MTTPLLTPEPPDDPPQKNKNRMDFQAARLDQTYATGSVKKKLRQVPIRKPASHWWFRVHPDESLHYRSRFYEIKEDSELYTVTAEMQPDLEEILVSKVLYPAITRQGMFFLWPVRLPDSDGRLDSWNRSAMNAAQIAISKWARITSNRQMAGYDIRDIVLDAVPTWPEIESIDDILGIAFQHYTIDNHDHPRIKNLRGEL